MEKIVTCTKCQKTFKVSGPYSKVKERPQGFTCPFCGGLNEVMWPMDTGFTTIPEKQAANIAEFKCFCQTCEELNQTA